MLKTRLLTILFLTGFLNGNCQVKDTLPTEIFQNEMKKLVELNSHIPHLTDFSGKEAINITTNATASQIIEITAPYLTVKTLNAKTVCLDLLQETLFKKAKDENQKQEITEILCKNFLGNNEEIQLVHNCLLQLSEKDFNANAKKYITALIDSMPKFYSDICAQFLAIAQIKKSIPVLWKVTHTTIATIHSYDLDILAPLARMDEKKAGILLCNYYNGNQNDTGYRHVLIAKKLAFSLDKSVLNCLIANYKTIDIKLALHDGDERFWPSQYLAACIVSMLKNYPYPKKDYQVKPEQLSSWLNESKQYQLNEK